MGGGGGGGEGDGRAEGVTAAFINTPQSSLTLCFFIIIISSSSSSSSSSPPSNVALLPQRPYGLLGAGSAG